MNDSGKSRRKVTVLISRIEQDCRLNLSRLIEDGKSAAVNWNVEWNSPCWDVRKVFAHTKRSHRSERHAMNFWFTGRSLRPKTPGEPLPSPFGDVVRSLVVLRHQVGNQCFVDQQQVIIASQFIAQQIKDRDHDLVLLTPGDLDRACQTISETQKPSTAYKLHRFVEEIAAIFDRNRLCSRRLNFTYAGKKRPVSVSGLEYVRLDDPDLAAGASSKLIHEEVLKALGLLYQAIPKVNIPHRLMINIVVIAVCTGRRIGEILTLPKQRIRRDRRGCAYLLYYKEKRSQGCQNVVLDKMYLIPQTIPLIEEALDECIELTEEARKAATRIHETGKPDFNLPSEGFISKLQLEQVLGLARKGGGQWLSIRRIRPVQRHDDGFLYSMQDIIERTTDELFKGPAVHVTPPGDDLLLQDLLFIAFKQAFHSRKAQMKYAVWPINVRHVGDFLGARGIGAFKRYFSGKPEAAFNVNTHQFRHTLNTLLEKGGLSDALQTEWFGRKNPADTQAYQHMTPAEKGWATYQATADKFPRKIPPLRLTTHDDAINAAIQFPVLDIGPGWCQHDWRSRPCPRQLETALDFEAIGWVPPELETRLQELERMRESTESMLCKAEHQLLELNPNADQWVGHLRQRLDNIRTAIDVLENNIARKHKHSSGISGNQ